MNEVESTNGSTIDASRWRCGVLDAVSDDLAGAEELTVEIAITGNVPNEVAINGEKYIRQEEDKAAALIRRIYRISRDEGCTLAEAAWAVQKTSSAIFLEWPE